MSFHQAASGKRVVWAVMVVMWADVVWGNVKDVRVRVSALLLLGACGETTFFCLLFFGFLLSLLSGSEVYVCVCVCVSVCVCLTTES